MHQYPPTQTKKLDSYMDEIQEALDEYKNKYNIVLGDFNIKLETKQEESDESIEKYGVEERNRSGEMFKWKQSIHDSLLLQ